MIQVENLAKSYGSQEAVRSLTFQVPKGQVCGFLGPNGAGKSTTLRMLTGFLAPTTGTIRVGGVDALARPIEARKLIGYMPEACPLYPEMRVREYLSYRAELKGLPRRQIKSSVAAALEQAVVQDVESRIIGQLSKGYRQRVGLADALVADPPLLVLDEPTAGLDPNQIRQVRTLIGRLAENKTVLLSTHILPEVEAICDRVLILSKGKLVSEGVPSTLRAEMQGGETIRVVGRGRRSAFEAALGSLSGVEIEQISSKGELVTARLRADGEDDSEQLDIAERVFRAVAEAGLTLRELRRKQASLEDVFAELTTEPDADAPDSGRGAGVDEEE